MHSFQLVCFNLHYYDLIKFMISIFGIKNGCVILYFRLIRTFLVDNHNYSCMEVKIIKIEEKRGQIKPGISCFISLF